MSAPTPDVIRTARQRAGLSQTKAADLVGLGCVQRWSEYERGVQRIDATRWEYFLLRTGQHPDYLLVARPEAPAEPSGRLARIAADSLALMETP